MQLNERRLYLARWMGSWLDQTGFDSTSAPMALPSPMKGRMMRYFMISPYHIMRRGDLGTLCSISPPFLILMFGNCSLRRWPDASFSIYREYLRRAEWGITCLFCRVAAGPSEVLIFLESFNCYIVLQI